MTKTTITKKFQTTIPTEIREALGLKPGQKVEWHMLGNKAVLEPPRKIEMPAEFLIGQVKLDLDAVRLVREVRKELG